MAAQLTATVPQHLEFAVFSSKFTSTLILSCLLCIWYMLIFVGNLHVAVLWLTTAPMSRILVTQVLTKLVDHVHTLLLLWAQVHLKNLHVWFCFLTQRSSLFSEICQIRLDFDTFSTGISTKGVCSDSFAVTGTTLSTNTLPVLCGTLTGQHCKFWKLVHMTMLGLQKTVTMLTIDFFSVLWKCKI